MDNDNKLEQAGTFIFVVITLTITYFLVMAVIKVVETIVSIIDYIYQTLKALILTIINFITLCITTVFNGIAAVFQAVSNFFDWLGWSGTFTMALLIAATVYFTKKYILDRQIYVKENEAYIIESLPLFEKKSLFKGNYELRIGERLCGIIGLDPGNITSNELCYILKNGESIRLEVSFIWHIIDPLTFYPNSKDVNKKLWSMVERMLRLQLGQTDFEDLLCSPATFNNLICENINLYIEEFDEIGVRVENFAIRSLKNPRELVFLTAKYATTQSNGEYWRLE